MQYALNVRTLHEDVTLRVAFKMIILSKQILGRPAARPSTSNKRHGFAYKFATLYFTTIEFRNDTVMTDESGARMVPYDAVDSLDVLRPSSSHLSCH